MKPIQLSEFSRRCGGELLAEDQPIRGFSLDSRNVNSGDLFIAAKGARVDGHDFAQVAIDLGAVAALVEKPFGGPAVLVPNVLEALASMAASYRTEFSGPVIGITGSAGKTTTKEMLAAALSPLGEIAKTEGNRNTEWTAPLLWAEAGPETRAVVVEMAMRGFGQIAHLASFSKPTAAIITNIGHSHLEQVGSREGIAKAKGEILDGLPKDGFAALWREDDFFENLANRSPAPVLTFGTGEGCDCRLTDYAADDAGSEIGGQIRGKPWKARLPVIGRQLALNAAASLLVAAELGVDLEAACAGLTQTVLPPMRMQTLNVRGVKVILDAYNAAPASMIAAIQALAETPARRRVAVLGEMKELGDYTEQGHREVGEALNGSGIDEAIFLGEAMKTAMAAAPKVRSRYAQSVEGAAEQLAELQEGDAVLIKGSRSLALERIVVLWGGKVEAWTK